MQTQLEEAEKNGELDENDAEAINRLNYITEHFYDNNQVEEQTNTTNTNTSSTAYQTQTDKSELMSQLNNILLLTA